jgi:hypothetical protein
MSGCALGIEEPHRLQNPLQKEVCFFAFFLGADIIPFRQLIARSAKCLHPAALKLILVAFLRDSRLGSIGIVVMLNSPDAGTVIKHF